MPEGANVAYAPRKAVGVRMKAYWAKRRASKKRTTGKKTAMVRKKKATAETKEQP